MSTQELHIQLDILLQKVNSNWNKNFLPQEKDYFINSGILQYIRTRLNKLSNNKQLSVFDIMQRLHNLNSLFTTVPIDVTNINQKEAIYQLPFDFLGYISSEAKVYPICTNEELVLTPVTRHEVAFNPLNGVSGLTNYSISLFIGGNETILFDITALPFNYLPQDNIADYRKLFIYNNAILSKIRQSLPAGFKVKFNNKTQRFQISGSESFILEITRNGTTSVLSSVSIEGTVYNYNTELEADVRIVDEEFKSSIKNSHLSKSKDNSIVGYLRETSVILQKPINAVIPKVELTYICKPIQIDLFLGIDSDLPNEVLDEVITQVVQRIKGVISSDTYEKFARENTLIE